MINRLSLLLFFSLSFVLVSTSEASATVLTPPDSVRVRWIDGKKYLLHKVEPKESWGSLSKKYKCPVQQLKEANGGVQDLKIGQIINIPAVPATQATVAEPKVTDKKPASEPEKKVAPPVSASTSKTIPGKTPIYYTVKPGETLYSLSKRFEQSVEDLTKYNQLSSTTLKEGQKLIVGYAPSGNNTAVSPSPVAKQESKATPTENLALTQVTKVSPVSEKPTPAPVNNFDRATKTVSPVKKGNGGKTLMQVTETGVASWIQDGQINQDKYYGLHRTAPIGTIIKVTNRMNNQFVYVKIVGVLPDTGENDNVIVKVSQAVSGKLNALDALFQVELSYGIMQ